jgi:hypothetical protein
MLIRLWCPDLLAYRLNHSRRFVSARAHDCLDPDWPPSPRPLGLDGVTPCEWAAAAPGSAAGRMSLRRLEIRRSSHRYVPLTPSNPPSHNRRPPNMSASRAPAANVRYRCGGWLSAGGGGICLEADILDSPKRSPPASSVFPRASRCRKRRTPLQRLGSASRPVIDCPHYGRCCVQSAGSSSGPEALRFVLADVSPPLSDRYPT